MTTRLKKAIEQFGSIPETYELTVNEAASVCGVGHGRIRVAMRDGKLKAVRSGNRLVTTYEWLRQWQDKGSEELRVKREEVGERVLKLVGTRG